MSEAAKPSSTEKAPSKIQVSWGPIGKTIKDKFDCFPQPTVAGGIEAILLKNQAQLTDLMKLLKELHNFPVLLLINAVEYKEAFQLIYQLQRVQPEHKIFCVKVNVSKDNPEISSLTSIWGSANWYEKELWDLQGIKFAGHPDLRRILNPDAWEGHPMRKDYIPPIDALNGPITAVKETIGNLDHSIRTDVEIIEEPNISQQAPLEGNSQ